MNERVDGITNIKGQFKIDFDSLESLRDKMGDEKYLETLKKLRLSEENLIRELELKISKAHAEDEGALRKELDKKHMQE
jgi:hypothetical protein